MALSGTSGRTRSLITTVLVAVLTAVVWWLQGGAGGEDTADDPAPTPTVVASETAASVTAVPSPPTQAPPTTIAGDTIPETHDASGLPYVDLGDLPPEAAETVELIDAGGPFPYDKDGSTFGNFEGLLPDHEDGYYREYTVKTPGSPDRGARRIVGGAEGELYWTEDHYESFEVIWR